MKKLLGITLIIALVLVGCAPTQQQLVAEQGYYTMYATIAANAKPLVDIEIADPDKPANIKRIQVNLSQLDNYRQYVHQDYAAKWIPLAASLIPYGGLYFTAKALADIRGQNVYNVSGGSTVKTIEGVSFGNLGNSNTAGIFEVNQSYNPSTIVTNDTRTQTTTTTTGVTP
jgi:hypothetical protein